MARLDGNVLAGPLSAHFVGDATTAIATCTGCLDTAPLARASVEITAAGFVAHCRGCDGVILIVRDAVALDLVGVEALRISTPRQ